MTWVHDGVKIADPEQIVLESDPYRRLAFTWHTFTPEFTAKVGLSEDVRAQLLSEGRSRVSFTLEPQPGGEVVKLTVIHEAGESGSTVVDMVSEGWPPLLSSLKTLLETGEALPPNQA